MSAARRQNTIKAEMKMRENVDSSGWRDWFMASYSGIDLQTAQLRLHQNGQKSAGGSLSTVPRSNLHLQWRAAEKEYHRSQSRSRISTFFPAVTFPMTALRIATALAGDLRIDVGVRGRW